MALSAWGEPEKSGLLRDWKSTANGMEGAAAQCNDAFLPLDEIHQADAREVIGAVYQLANESGKQRLDRTSAAQERRTWRTMIISTGERDVAAMAAEAKQKLPAGADVRLPSIPVDGAEMWPIKHGANMFVELMGGLHKALKKQYGTAMRAFLSELTSALSDPENGISYRVEATRKQFYREIPEDSDPQVRDVVRRFALAVSAGELAIEWGIMPWAMDVPLVSAKVVMNQWLGRRDGAGGPRKDSTLRRSAPTWPSLAHRVSSIWNKERR